MRRRRIRVAVAAAAALAVHAILARAGDLRLAPGLLLAGHGALLVCMGAVWATLRAGAGGERIALAAALAFRLVGAAGEPRLSDDVYRYVWDGRVQRAGIHPYAHAPVDPELVPLRDDDWRRINHPDVPTIYPPLAQLLFAALAALGAGPHGFRLAFGALDFAVVIAMRRLLDRLDLPRHRWVLYGWNPLAVLETAGSGHVEPAGVLLVVLASGWIIRQSRAAASALALGAAVQVKLLPLVLVPGAVRRLRSAHVLLLGLAIALPVLPYAASGPPLGAGTIAYAERWEHNAVVFPVLRDVLARLDTGRSLGAAIAAVHGRVGVGWIPWDLAYRAAWPETLARLVVAVLAVAWILHLTFRRGLGPVRETFLALAGVLLLLPTLHPWYVLWVLPFAAVFASGPWLAFGALVAVSYAAADGDPGWGLRAVEYLPPFAWWTWSRWRGSEYHPGTETSPT
jgi:hypothetical protein